MGFGEVQHSSAFGGAQLAPKCQLALMKLNEAAFFSRGVALEMRYLKSKLLKHPMLLPACEGAVYNQGGEGYLLA